MLEGGNAFYIRNLFKARNDFLPSGSSAAIYSCFKQHIINQSI